MPTSTIRIRFATNRNRVQTNELFGPGFEGGDASSHVTGSIDVARVSNLPDTGWLPRVETLEIDPPATGVQRFIEDNSAVRAAAAGADAGYGLVLLPGFASTFIESLRRAAQVAAAYRAADVFCFSWPANGIVDIDNYKKDRKSAAASGAAIADALSQLFAKVGDLSAAKKPKLHIVAHSMGNFALRNAVQAIKKSDPDLIDQRVFEGAFLMAADEDFDALSDNAKLAPLIKLARNVTTYYAGGDTALGISEGLNGTRLGHAKPSDLASMPKSVTSVDCSDVASTQGDHGETHFSHQYYRLSSRVIGDVVQVLAGIKPGDIGGRLPDMVDPAGGRAFFLPFDANAGHVALAGKGSRRVG